jgi:glutamate-1-semialdehyde 2,1-aminomutase
MSRSTLNSQAAFAKAEEVMPGGVSSPVRAFKAVGGSPVFIKEGEGCRVVDIDGNSYIDYVASYGPLIAGHGNERVVAALSKQIGRGCSFGAPTELETQLASMVVSAVPSAQMVRFVNSGTEACMSALRLARAATGRDKIIKCIGCYHGHADSMLVQAGSGALTLGTPSSPGVPSSVASTTISVHFNDLEGTEAAFKKYGKDVAAIIVEPVPGNMGVILPAGGYLEGLRKLCDDHGALLIFDEVMSGFRIAWGGAQAFYSVLPDLTCLGKIIGGGLPVGAYAGPKKLMEQVSPAGKVYQAGTLSGNPLAMSAGIATLEILQEEKVYQMLDQRTASLAEGLAEAAAEANVPLAINRAGSMITPFFVRKHGLAVNNFGDACACDVAAYAKFFQVMLENGIYLPPSQFEAWFVGLAHDATAVEETIVAARAGFGAASGKAN